MKQFVTTMQYVFAAMGGAIGAVLGGFDGFFVCPDRLCGGGLYHGTYGSSHQ